jgi:L-rhamnose isomerase
MCIVSSSDIEKLYQLAAEKYFQAGVDTNKALNLLQGISLSIHCWQGDDIAGFEWAQSKLGDGGIQVTGNYPGKARNIDELRKDLNKVYSLLPGNHRLNLHAIYGDFAGKHVDRDSITPDHFTSWIEWAEQENLKLDFNPTCFSHPKAAAGFTLSSRDKAIRSFWIEHVKRCREISAFIGQKLKDTVINNIWIPDGYKDMPADRWQPRKLLRMSLDEIFSKEYPAAQMKDALESKLFGIGSESYVVGSHEFYMGYSISKGKMLCLDMGHFHPTESIADKISAVLQFSQELLLHISRGVRWDSDHVVVLNDDLLNLALEIVRGNVLQRIHFGLDFFDASINRIGAWVVGSRATLKAFLCALLYPHEKLQALEQEGRLFERLALMEEMKSMPAGVIWDYYCIKNNVPPGFDYIQEIQNYERMELVKRR